MITVVNYPVKIIFMKYLMIIQKKLIYMIENKKDYLEYNFKIK